MITTKMYDKFTRLLAIDNAPSGDNQSTSFGYDYNSANQRTAMIDQRGFTWDYQYDNLGQLSESKISFPGDNVSLFYRYVFDTIGNRTQEKIGFENPENFAVWDYSSNSVNQYQSKTHDNVTDNFTYDADGNLAQDKDWNYTWDAENRPVALSSLETRNGNPTRKLKFVYDDQGRRVSKKVEDLTADNTTYNLTLYRRFIYDRWNLLAELDENANPVRTYVWGNDVSGSMQGAGGIGGLLMVKHWNSDDNITCFPAYDGNGNVRRMVRSDNGTTHTYFSYDAFGQTFTHSDNPGTPNPFGFSTKYYDDETKQYYLGKRPYDPETGRLITCDPIGENGGLNLYEYVKNNPINNIDPLGEKCFDGPSAIDCNEWYRRELADLLKFTTRCHSDCGVGPIGKGGVVCWTLCKYIGGPYGVVCTVVCSTPFAFLTLYCHHKCDDMVWNMGQWLNDAHKRCLDRARD